MFFKRSVRFVCDVLVSSTASGYDNDKAWVIPNASSANWIYKKKALDVRSIRLLTTNVRVSRKKKVRQGLLFTEFPLLEKQTVEGNTDPTGSSFDVRFELIRARFRWTTASNHSQKNDIDHIVRSMNSQLPPRRRWGDAKQLDQTALQRRNQNKMAGRFFFLFFYFLMDGSEKFRQDKISQVFVLCKKKTTTKKKTTRSNRNVRVFKSYKGLNLRWQTQTTAIHF